MDRRRTEDGSVILDFLSVWFQLAHVGDATSWDGMVREQTGQSAWVPTKDEDQLERGRVGQGRSPVEEHKT